MLRGLCAVSSGIACRLFAALWVLILIGFMQVMISCYFMIHTVMTLIKPMPLFMVIVKVYLVNFLNVDLAPGGR